MDGTMQDVPPTPATGARELRYRVVIQYREPTYEERTRPRARPFSIGFDVSAPDPDAAREQALARFWAVHRASSVGWVKRVERVLVREASDEAGSV